MPTCDSRAVVDLINACFVGAAVVLAFLDYRTIVRDREYRGSHLGTALLFTVWPMWDMVYYCTLGQYTSLAVCAVLAVIRGLWFVQVVRATPWHDVRNRLSLR